MDEEMTAYVKDRLNQVALNIYDAIFPLVPRIKEEINYHIVRNLVGQSFENARRAIQDDPSTLEPVLSEIEKKAIEFYKSRTLPSPI